MLALTALITLACKKEDTANDKLELVFEDSTYQVTGISKEENGRLLINYPRWSAIYKYSSSAGAGNDWENSLSQ